MESIIKLTTSWQLRNNTQLGSEHTHTHTHTHTHKHTHTLTVRVHQHRWQRPPPLPASHNIYIVCSLVAPSPARTPGTSTGSPPPCSSAPTAAQRHTFTNTPSADKCTGCTYKHWTPRLFGKQSYCFPTNNMNLKLHKAVFLQLRKNIVFFK